MRSLDREIVRSLDREIVVSLSRGLVNMAPLDRSRGLARNIVNIQWISRLELCLKFAHFGAVMYFLVEIMRIDKGKIRRGCVHFSARFCR